MLERWEAMDIYGRIRQAAARRPLWILHDGPALCQRPHPHGDGAQQDPEGLRREVARRCSATTPCTCRDGTATGCRSSTRSTSSSAWTRPRSTCARPWIPSRRSGAAATTRTQFIDIQRAEFKRLGVFGDWQHPYATLTPDYEAVIVREFGRFVGQGSVYKGLKPVHWCMHCKTALAQAEVEYEDQTHAVGLREVPRDGGVAGRGRGARRAQGRRSSSGPRRRGRCPPTSPSPPTRRETYTAVELDGEALIVARPLLDAFMRLDGVRGRGTAPAALSLRGADLAGTALPTSLDRPRGAGGRRGLRGHGHGHRARAHRARPRRGGLRARAQGAGSGSTTRWTTTAASSPRSSTSPGMTVWEANPRIIERLSRGRRPRRLGAAHPHVSALLAVQEPDAVPGHRAVVHQPGQERAAPEGARRHPPERALDPRVGRGAHLQHGGAPARLGALAPARVGRAHRRVLLPRLRRAAPRRARHRPRRGDLPRRPRHRGVVPAPGVRAGPAGHALRRVRRRRRSGRETDILDVWVDSGCSHAAVLEKRPELRWPADMYLEGSDQHRGWFHSSLLEAVGTRGAAAVPGRPHPRLRGRRRRAKDVEVPGQLHHARTS